MSHAHALEHPPLVIPPGLRHTRARRWRFIIAALLGAILLTLGAHRLMRTQVVSAQHRTAAAERRSITQTVEASGDLDVPRRFEVAAPAEGRLVEIRVESGARVRRGDVLARLDPRAATLDVRTARAQERAAEGRLADAEARYRAALDKRKRVEHLVKLELAQKRHLTEARFAEESARGARDAARAERDVIGKKRAAAELLQSELTLRAPADGFVLSLPRSSGVLASQERGPLFTIGDTLDRLRLEALVAEADIGAVRPGQSARFSVPAFADASFVARVEQVLVEPERRAGAVSYRVLLSAENRDHRLMPGMSASVSIAVAEAKDVLCVREAALRFTPEGAEAAPPRSRVWVGADRARPSPVAVVTGISDGAFTQVEPVAGTGLSPGDPVIIGTLAPEADDAAGPGIRLGRRP